MPLRGSRGCLEAYVGAEAILDDYLRLPGATAFRATGTEARLAELIADSVEPGPAAQTLDTAAEVLGIGIAGLVNLLNPDHVVLSGWVGLALGPKVLSAVEATVRRHALPYLAGNAPDRGGRAGSGGGGDGRRDHAGCAAFDGWRGKRGRERALTFACFGLSLSQKQRPSPRSAHAV
ncbi:ROK family protein [Fodinicola feengrottensis]|uniref:ROK family protein n=1 Tax=Fodinicola feengrottensis TaxID=435914 RepID=UPI002442C16E|nr:ROK family protein [Fodinicola feengrottensis]